MDNEGEQIALEDVQPFFFETDMLGIMKLSGGRLQCLDDKAKEKIDKLWGLSQYKTDVDTSMVKAD